MSPGVGAVGAVLEQARKYVAARERWVAAYQAEFGKFSFSALMLETEQAEAALEQLPSRDELACALVALAAQAEAGAGEAARIVQEVVTTRCVHDQAVRRLDDLLGERDWQDAVLDPEFMAQQGVYTSTRRASVEALKQLDAHIAVRVASAQASAGGEV